MKLIDREPTLKMIEATRFYKEGAHTMAWVWRAMYDAAPNIKQEPIGYIDGHYGFVRTKEGINMQIGAKAYAFPPDAQAEIDKRDARIKALEQAIDNEMVVSHLGVFNPGDDPKVALNKLQCYAEDLGSFFAQDQLNLQATEIAQLKYALLRITKVKADTVTTAYDMRRIAIAAIKEIENAGH